MRRRWNRIAGVVALVATLGTAAAVFRIDPDVVTQIATPPTGLWIPAPASGDVVHVDAARGDVTARVNVGEPGAEFVLDEQEQGVVVVDRTAGRVSLVDPAFNEVVNTVDGVAGPESLVDIGPEVVAMGAANQVVLVDPAVTTATTASVGGSLRSLAADAAAVRLETGGDRLRVEPDGSVSTDGSSPGVLVRVGERVLVATSGGVESLSGDGVACFDGAVEAPSHVVGSSIGWVVAVVGSAVHVADTSNGDCAVVELGEATGELGRPVVAGRRVYVPERRNGAVHIIEPSRGVAVRHDVFSAGDLRLRARADFVAAYDAVSPVAALLDANGVTQVVDTSVGSRGITAVVNDDGAAAVVGGEGDDAGVSDDGVDGVSTASDAPVLDAGVLAATLSDPPDESALPDDTLVANFAFSATTVSVGESVRFVDGSTGGPETWLWDFGDGTGAEGPEVRKSWDEPGSYPVTLRVTRGDERDEISLKITVVPAEAPRPPAADFALSSSVVSVGQAVEFEDRSDGDIERWRWNFGDGTSATTPDATKSWSRAGSYTVVLTVANAQGTDTTSAVVEVVDGLRAPVAEIDVASARVDLGEAITFEGSSSTGPASFTWNFGDGRTSSGKKVVHVFLEEGTFTVRLTASNAAGRSTAEVDIVVAPPTKPPIAAIGALPAVIEAGDVVSMTSLSSNAPDSVTWSFGDGSEATGQRVTHVWETPGTYLLTLTATNAAGTDTTTRTVEVVAELPAPVARIGDFTKSPWVGTAALFIDASVDATSWLWDFGDGVTSTARDPLHTFTSAGPKTVTLTVANRNGSDSTSVVVEPRLEPVASFIASRVAIRAGESVMFTDDSVNAASWSWRFGDGTTSTAQNPTHTFTSPGTYGVVLTIRSATGDQDSFGPVSIEVDPAPPRLAGILKVQPTGSIVTLTTAAFAAEVAATSGPIDLYQINFGDGSPLAQNTTGTFSHVYGESGTYDVTMQARGPLGDFSVPVVRSFTVVDPAPPAVAMAAGVDDALVGEMRLEGTTLPGSGPIDTWRWEITSLPPGSSWTYTGRIAQHDFQTPGNYRVRLIAESPVASVPDDVVTRNITISIPPPPSITALVASPTTATQGGPVPVRFTPTVTGSVATWEWNYGNGFVTGGRIGENIFNTTGSIQVTLRVTGPYGGVDTRSTTVTVVPAPAPTAPVASPAGAVAPGTTVAFTSSEPNGLSGLTWDWFVTPSGSSSPTAQYLDRGPSVSHQFNTAGQWTVTVRVTDARGVAGSASSVVTVQAPLVAAFDCAPTIVPLQVACTDLSTGPAVQSWFWDFGGGITSTQANPTVTFPTAGARNVTLRVTSGGQTAQVTKVVTV